ncbi:MAG: DUF2953 domain-containing protein [Acutalibacteraceae bacterium]
MTWTWWMTLLAIFAALVLIGCIPVGVDARYNAEGVFLAAKLGPIRLQLLPQKPKRKETAKAAKETGKGTGKSRFAGKKPNPILSGGVDGILQLLDIVLDTLGDLRRKLRVNELTLYVRIGGSDDPAKAAMGYGRAWAAIGAITPSLERLFVIKKRDIQPSLDYTISNTQVDAHLVTTITIGRSLALALRAGIRFLKILNERKKAV